MISLMPLRIPRRIWKAAGLCDLVIFADKEKRQVTADFKSKAANSPFVGEELTGSVKYTICDGEIVYQA